MNSGHKMPEYGFRVYLKMGDIFRNRDETGVKRA